MKQNMNVSTRHLWHLQLTTSVPVLTRVSREAYLDFQLNTQQSPVSVLHSLKTVVASVNFKLVVVHCL